MVKVSLNLFKELKWLFTFFGITSLTVATHFNTFLNFVFLYNIHIIVLFGFFCWFLFTVFNVRIKNLETQINENIKNKEDKIVNLIEDMHRDQTAYQIAELAKDLADVKEITKDRTIKKIYSLEKSLVKLGLNSYSQDAIEDMKSRIVFGKD